jgi:hypothetical protein
MQVTQNNQKIEIHDQHEHHNHVNTDGTSVEYRVVGTQKDIRNQSWG